MEIHVNARKFTEIYRNKRKIHGNERKYIEIDENARKYIEIRKNYCKLHKNAWQCQLMYTFYYGHTSNQINCRSNH